MALNLRIAVDTCRLLRDAVAISAAFCCNAGFTRAYSYVHCRDTSYIKRNVITGLMQGPKATKRQSKEKAEVSRKTATQKDMVTFRRTGETSVYPKFRKKPLRQKKFYFAVPSNMPLKILIFYRDCSNCTEAKSGACWRILKGEELTLDAPFLGAWHRNNDQRANT